VKVQVLVQAEVPLQQALAQRPRRPVGAQVKEEEEEEKLSPSSKIVSQLSI
jgi:hypothetical protein